MPPDMTIVAIDGPAGAGKSTVARIVAGRLGLCFLDTGAMYRALTWVAIQRGIDPKDRARLEALAGQLELDFDRNGRIRIDGQPGEPMIRRPEVEAQVSDVSMHPGLRERIVARQRELAMRWRGAVAEGRDTTTAVFPDATFKFFLHASPEIRARRRALQLGSPEREGEILAAILERDRKDKQRPVSPLTEAPDAQRIEADGPDASEVAERIVGLVLARRPELAPRANPCGNPEPADGA
jgi:CMP/dCMP kinase